MPRRLRCTARPELIEPGSVTGFSSLLLNTGIYTSKGIQSVRKICGEVFNRNGRGSEEVEMEWQNTMEIGNNIRTHVGRK